MTIHNPEPLRGVVMDETVTVSITHLCESCCVEVDVVVQMVRYGILEPSSAGEDAHDWQFSGPSLQRATTALRLQRDLGVNLQGAALALDLMDELQQLRRRSIP